MNRMRRAWLALSILALGVGAAACGGSAKMAGPAGEPPSGANGGTDTAAALPAEEAAGKASVEAEAPASPSFGQPGVAQNAPPPPPAATPSAPAGEAGPASGSGRAAPMPSRMSKLDSSTPRTEAAKPKPREKAPESVDRPGLGTQWGETRRSEITTVPFVRADLTSPFSIASLFYNDEQGAQAMSSQTGFRRTAAGTFTIANGAVAIGLRDESGHFLTGFMAGDRNFIVGEAGRRYSIVLRNRTPIRFECVISVDGLDVLDGKTASFSKRGYLLDPNGELEIDGFRQSMDAVAAFRFGSVRGSYANQKHGDTRNVGVIGVALFHERGTNPFQWSPQEVDRRNDANPFPGQFATPPPNR